MMLSLFVALVTFYALLLLGTLFRIATALEAIATAYQKWNGGEDDPGTQ